MKTQTLSPQKQAVLNRALDKLDGLEVQPGETVLTFTLPYPPSANRYWRNVKGRMVVSADARAYKEEVGWKIKPKVKEPLAGDVYVKVRIFRPRKIGDLDNTLKVLLDALKGIVFLDDEQVVEIRANRFDDKANPRAEVTVEARVLSSSRRP